MLSLQQAGAPSKQRLGHLESAEIQLHLLNNTRRPFSCGTHYKQKQGSLTRHSPPSKHKDSPKTTIDLETANIVTEDTGDCVSTSNSKSNQRLQTTQPRKSSVSSNLPPRLRERRQQQLGKNKKSLNSGRRNARKETSQIPSKMLPPTTTQGDSPQDTEPSQREAIISVELCHIDERSSDQNGSLESQDNRLSVDLLSPVRHGHSRQSSLGSDEDFQDALSDFPASGMSSTRSSAFVTPASTRSQSPVNSIHSSLFSEHTQSLDLVQERLEELSRSSPEDTPSCGSHVTLIEGLENENTTGCPYSFLHNSHIDEPDSEPILPRQYSSDAMTMLVGDIEVEVNGQKDDSFELPCSPVEYNDEEHDSGCSMSIDSPSKSSLKLKTKRPGLIYMPKEVMERAKREPRASFELSSLSTASPASSVCSPSSNSPLSISPPPSANQPPQESYQEWPDFDKPAAHYVNGVVQHSDNAHRPTEEERLKVEQWHTSLINQLREQQEKLDQKKKKETSSLPPQFPIYLPQEPFNPLRSLPPTLPPHTGLQGPVMNLPPPGYWPLPPPPSVFLRPQPIIRPVPQPPKSYTMHNNAPIADCASHPVENRHPLCDHWVMWYDRITGSHKNSNVVDYQASLKKVCTVSTIESFWGLLNNIKTPSGLENNCNYHFFKEGINPMWEDEANQKGGKWVLTIKDDPEGLDKAWMEVLLMLIGGCVSRKDIVNGIVVSRRKKGNKISVWTSQTDKTANLDICKELIEALMLACDVRVDELPAFLKDLSEYKRGYGLVFMHHTDSLRTGSSYHNQSHIQLKDYIKDLLFVLSPR